MSKVRIYELARDTGLSNKEVIRRLTDLGVEAKSHSSTVEEPDAARFLDGLGRQREARRREQEEHERREAEEYDLEAIKAPALASAARRILPPHLRQQQEAAAKAATAPAAAPQAPPPEAPRFRPPATPFRPSAPAGVSVGGDDDVAPAGQPERPGAAASAGAQVPTRRPAMPDQPDDDRSATAAEAARAGVVRPAGAVASPTQQPVARDQREERELQDEEPRGIPGVPRPGTPPRPGQPTVPRMPTSPTATGMPVQPLRRVEPNLPREGSGKRSIPPPLRPAPQDRPAAARQGAPGAGRPAGGRPPGGRPSPGGRPTDGRPAAPGRAAPGAGRPGGPPPAGGRPPGGGRPGAPGAGRKGKKGKRRKDPTLQEQFEAEAQPRQRRGGPVKAAVSGPVDVLPGITVGEFAKAVGVNPTDVVRVLFGMGEMITVTQSMSADLIELVAAEMDADVNFVTPEDLEFGAEEGDRPEDLEPRAPVVTVVGHVDHGKTLLLDAIRSTDVAGGEAGGITQAIGAYQVTKDGRKITFIDTPGHEAFTQMRARGANVADVAILVVAADDGVMPQTVEAINHVKAAGVPIIVAVNKVDKEDADPVRVRTQLTEHDLIAEEFGGQTTMVDVSAKTKQGLDDLLELVLLQADVADLRANPHRRSRGAVIEAHLDRGRGPVATVLVQAGTLHTADSVVAGIADGKVRAMFDDDGNQVTDAGPSKPVQVLGWTEVPDAGDEFRVVDDERAARDIAAGRQARQRRMELAERQPVSLEDLSGAIAEGQLQTLNLIIKGDTAGSVEALADALSKLELDEVKVNILHKGVGAVTQSDVDFAEAENTIIIAFNVRPDANARQAIEESGVDLRQYSIIYQATEDIEQAVKGMLAPEFTEVVVGRAQVREIFRVPRAGFVFGCYVTEGDIRRNANARVVRDGVVVANDTISSLRRFKEDVTEVTSGYECGIGLDRFQDVREGDEFEVFESREVARS